MGCQEVGASCFQPVSFLPSSRLAVGRGKAMEHVVISHAAVSSISENAFGFYFSRHPKTHNESFNSTRPLGR